MTTIADIYGLPSGGGVATYLRSKLEPRALIDTRTGAVFTRADGEPWYSPAYLVHDNGPRQKPSVESRSAYCDDKTYGSKERAA